ncbi:hypothetical protein [Pontibacter sp. G13]|uniref:hypothetical protein n=1 Tax=Pontibacter sp. G13 TaxID=3074898 RepID=UPI00288B7D26|nr:hypothetical protein [Pontibacter sp. G13]WNJ16010.1 hypothetical protein RJD25_14200 [Pontibacter sp. G13]
MRYLALGADGVQGCEVPERPTVGRVPELAEGPSDQRVWKGLTRRLNVPGRDLTASTPGHTQMKLKQKDPLKV